MATQVKCIYENGFLKPLGKIDLDNETEVVITVEKTEREVEKELKEAYVELAEESRLITEEWRHTEKDLETFE